MVLPRTRLSLVGAGDEGWDGDDPELPHEASSVHATAAHAARRVRAGTTAASGVLQPLRRGSAG